MDFRTALFKVIGSGVATADLMDAVSLADLLVASYEDGVYAGQSKARVINEVNHDTLVAACLGTPAILFEVGKGRRVQAIKILRELTGAGLKPAKEAVEDGQVTVAGRAVAQDPWATDPYSEEPPF